MRRRLGPPAGLATVFAVANFACIAATSAAAQNYPDHLIKIIVPFTAGGPVDLVARLIGQRMAPILGQRLLKIASAAAA
jgi:tripartite-type tricarboxylate transporter receptor subunit TctC